MERGAAILNQILRHSLARKPDDIAQKVGEYIDAWVEQFFLAFQDPFDYLAIQLFMNTPQVFVNVQNMNLSAGNISADIVEAINAILSLVSLNMLPPPQQFEPGAIPLNLPLAPLLNDLTAICSFFVSMEFEQFDAFVDPNSRTLNFRLTLL